MPTSTPNDNRRGRVSQADIDSADEQLALAFQLCGLVADGNLVCPVCSAAKPKKVQLKTSAKGRPYWTCHPCGAHGSATKLLREQQGLKLPQAVDVLLGRAEHKADPTKLPDIVVAPSFTAVVDVEVYDFIRDSGSLEKAQAYYAAWHISPDAVARAGSRYLTNCKQLQAQLLAKFGSDRLRECGVLTTDRNGNDLFLFSDDYPVIEAHETPRGHVVGMQFRPSPRQRAKVESHKKWKRRWSGQRDDKNNVLEPSEAWAVAYAKDPKAAGEKVPYVTPFLSLRGAGTSSLLGGGLATIAKAPKGSKVYVVEGHKDLMAGYTMGALGYSIPGTGNMPSEKVCRLLADYEVIVALDGDAAGAKGRAKLLEHLAKHNVPAKEKTGIREGLDIADILVERHAHNACKCATCHDWREAHPYEPATCPCKTCTDKRR